MKTINMAAAMILVTQIGVAKEADDIERHPRGHQTPPPQLMSDEDSFDLFRLPLLFEGYGIKIYQHPGDQLQCCFDGASLVGHRLTVDFMVVDESYPQENVGRYKDRLPRILSIDMDTNSDFKEIHRRCSKFLIDAQLVSDTEGNIATMKIAAFPMILVDSDIDE